MDRRKGLNNWGYIGILFILSIIMIAPFFFPHQLGVHSDWSFHSARVQQIYLNLKRGQLFTFIATDTFSKIGNGNFLFYPSIFLYPWATLKLILEPIEAFLTYVWLLMFATMLVSYYCMLNFSKGEKLTAFFFAIIYTIVPYHLYLTLGNYVLGEAQAYTFIPIVLLGMYKVLNNKGWKTLGIGITLEMYCHLVDTFIAIEVCLILFLVWLLFSNSLTWQVIINICKSVVLFVVLSLWIFVPLLSDYLGKGLNTPGSGFMLVKDLGDYFSGCFSNLPLNTGGLGLVLAITLLFGWKWCRKGTQDIYIYIVGVLLSVMITSAFPWQWFKSTPLAVIQFPYRYTSFAACFLSSIAAIGIKRITLITEKKLIVVSLAVVTLLGLYAGEIYPLLSRNKNVLNDIPVLHYERQGKYQTLRDATDTPIIISNAEYNKQFSYGALYGEQDYFPQQSMAKVMTILNRKAYLNRESLNYQQYSEPNRIIYHFKAKQEGKINLPALVYNHSILLVDGKIKTVEQSARGTVSVFVNKGEHSVIVGYRPSTFYYIAIIISIIGWCVLAFRVSIKKLSMTKV